MSIADSYREFLADQILKEYLVDQVNPSITQLEEDMRAIEEWFTDMSQPMLKFRNVTVEEREESSAGKFNEMQAAILSDLYVLYGQTAEQISNSVDFLNRNLSEISMLKVILKDLENRLDELLLQNRDTEGYFQFFYDTFNNMRYIDAQETTVAIDLKGGYVTMKEAADSRQKFNLNFVSLDDIAFNILTRERLASGQKADFVDNSAVNAFRDGTDPWRQSVTTTAPVPLSADFKVYIGDDKSVSKVVFENLQDDTYSSVTVHLQYSTDNYNWFDWPGTPFVQNIQTKGTFSAKTLPMKWLKFTLTKSGHDRVKDGKYITYFGAKKISVYGLDYDEAGSRLQSIAISPEDRDGQQGFINRVSIETCEDLPAKTDILYAVSFDGGELWIPISPVNRTVPKFPKVVSLNKISSQFDGPFGWVTPFEQVNTEDAAIDFDATDIDPYSTTIWRNVGEKGNVDNVRTVQRGWTYDSEFYSCYLWINEFYGIEVDFGDTDAEIDGVVVTGRYTIPYGRHYFRTRQANWVSVGELTEITAEIDDDGTMTDSVRGAVVDPLYPYNHKYIIEGVPYQDDLLGRDQRSRIYIGSTRFAAELPAIISAFDLTNNAKPDDYTLAAKQGNEFIHKYDPGDPDVSNEVFVVQYFLATATDLPESVILRADLYSEEPGVTPVLYDYKIKFDPYYET